MNEVAQGNKWLKIVVWNPKEIAGESATTIADVEDDAEGKPRSIGEFLRSLPKEQRVAVKKIPGFALTENHEYREWGIQEVADTLGLSVAVYVYERGYHAEPEYQFRVNPHPR